MGAPEDERPYTLDDLVSHEKGQMRLVLLVLIVAMIYFAGRRVAIGPEADPADVAPVGTREER